MISLLAAMLLGSVDSETYSTKEYRTFPPHKLDRTVRRDLMSIFQPLESLPKGNLIGLGNVTLTTKGVATNVPGVCARDWLTIRYAPVENTEDPPNGDVRPYAADAERQYYFLKRPSRSSLEKADDRLPWSAECERAAKVEYEGWFSADSAYSAVRTYLIFLSGSEAVRRDATKLGDCDPGPHNSCAEQLQDLAASMDFGAFGQCGEPSEADDCYEVEVAGYVVRVRAKRNSDATDPQNVTAVTLGGMIVLT